MRQFDPNVYTGRPIKSTRPRVIGHGKKSVKTVAREVIAGKWGSGPDRVNRLAAAGYDYEAVQMAVNQMFTRRDRLRKLRETAAGSLIASIAILLCTAVIAYLLWDCFKVSHPIQPVALGMSLFYSGYSLGAYMAYRRVKED